MQTKEPNEQQATNDGEEKKSDKMGSNVHLFATP